ncbi:MAG: CrcB family protein [Myxococcota bacterium]
MAIAAGGALGASLRFGCTRAAMTLAPDQLWWATGASNVIGALLLGLLLARVDDQRSPLLRPFLATGLLGSFTTFSTLLLENSQFFETSPASALLHLGLIIGLGLLAFTAGEAIGSPSTRGLGS